MSVKVVVPPSSISRHARRVPQRTKSALTFLASAGKMNFSSQSCSRRSSAIPRNRLIAACVWVLIKPGARIASGRSSRCLVLYFALISARVPTATMRWPFTATAPFSITRCCASSVMTYRALQIASTGSAAWSMPASRQSVTEACTPGLLALRDNTGPRRCSAGLWPPETILEKRRIERPGKQFLQLHLLRFASRIEQRDLDIATEFPQNLPARPARRRQVVGIRRDRDPTEPAHALADRLEHRDPLRAHRQPVGRVLDVAPGMNAPVRVFERRAHLKMREPRERIRAYRQRRCFEWILWHRLSACHAASLGSSAFSSRTSVSRTISPASSPPW